MAVTVASARVFTRIALIKTQFRQALRRTTSISLDSLTKLETGLDNRWIEQINIYGLNQSNLCRAELFLSIDWREHDMQISVGRAKVAVDERWVDNTAIEVDEAVRLFDSFVHQYGLKTEWRVSYVSSVYADPSLLQRVRRELGLQAAEPVKWTGPKDNWRTSIPELQEVHVGCYFSF